MRAHELDRRITLQELQAQLDAAGQAVERYVDVATLWARVTPLRGNEAFLSQQRFADATHRFRIRWRSGVTARHRVLYEEKPYGVVEALEVGRRQWLDIVAVASPAEDPVE